MSNGNMPFQPCGPDGLPSYEAEFGITKREMIAMHMMESLTSIYWDTVGEYETGADLVKCQAETAVKMADALLAELERTSGAES